MEPEGVEKVPDEVSRVGPARCERLAPQGLVPFYETGLFAGDDDYRVPDRTYAGPELVTERGVRNGAELVVEILSPGDETHDKLDWYTRMGVGEVLVVDPDTSTVELFAGRAGKAVLVQPGADGTVRLTSLPGVALRTTDAAPPDRLGQGTRRNLKTGQGRPKGTVPARQPGTSRS